MADCLIRVKVRLARLKRYTKTKRAQPNTQNRQQKCIKKRKTTGTPHRPRQTAYGQRRRRRRRRRNQFTCLLAAAKAKAQRKANDQQICVHKQSRARECERQRLSEWESEPARRQGSKQTGFAINWRRRTHRPTRCCDDNVYYPDVKLPLPAWRLFLCCLLFTLYGC